MEQLNKHPAMVEKQRFQVVAKKINKAWLKNKKSLKEAHNLEKISFLCGYKIALNEIAGWLEMELKQKKRH